MLAEKTAKNFSGLLFCRTLYVVFAIVCVVFRLIFL